MRESIEDRIIAYFDGRLTDDESADLLHRVSVSPEIRKLFREHETLREITHTAQATTVVRPEIEANLFARIEAIANGEREATPREAAPVIAERKRRVIMPLFWTRWRMGLAAATGAFLIGTAVMLGPQWIGNDKPAGIEREQATGPRTQNPENGTTVEQASITSHDKFEASQEFAREPNNLASKPNFSKQTGGDRKYEERMVMNERPRAIGERYTSESTTNTFTVADRRENISTDNTASNNSPEVTTSDIAALPERQINTVSIKTSGPLMVGLERNTPVFRSQLMERNQADQFEFAIESSTGFAYPASDPGVQPFADTRLSLGYFLDNNNIVGVRATYGLFEVLPQQPTKIISSAYTSFQRNLETARLFNPGVYFTHREYSVFGDYIHLDASVGAGYILDGYTLSGEVGLKFPISSHINTAVSFTLTRVSLNSESMVDVMESMELPGTVIFEGSDIRNTLNGRLQYGLSYQF